MVTGGAGFLGSWVTRRLVEEGHRPVSFSRSADQTLLRDIWQEIDFVKGDVTDREALLASLRDYHVDRIAHLAWSLGPIYRDTPDYAIQVNILGCLNVLEAARKLDLKRVVFTSAKGVYGYVAGVHGHPTYQPISEDNPLGPVTMYDGCKVACERIGNSYRELFGIEFAACRFAETWGPGKNLFGRHEGLALTSLLIENAMLGRHTKIPVGADSREDYIYNRDAAKGIVMACLAPELKHTIYNFGNGKAFSLQDFADALKLVFPDTRVEIGPGLDYKRGGADPVHGYYVLDVSRARSDLGFVPEYDFERGIRDYVATMQRLGIEPKAGDYYPGWKGGSAA